MRFLLILLSSLMVFGCSAKSESELYQLGNQSAVRVLTPSGRPHGSGFITKGSSGNTVVITNEHVCKGSNTWLLQFEGLGELRVYASPTYQDHNIDLCAFALPREFQRELVPLPIAYGLSRHQHVSIVGYPREFPLTISQGFTTEMAVLDIAEPGADCANPQFNFFVGLYCIHQELLVMTSVITYPGNSGSMALDDYGQVVGVLNSGDSDTHYGNLVPLIELKEFLEKL